MASNGPAWWERAITHFCCRVEVEQLGGEEASQNGSPAVKEARYLSLSIQIEHVQPWKKRQNLPLGAQQTKHLIAL
jgi:hypothetical protein